MKTINTLRKVSLATLLTFVLSFSSVFAQNDTMYVMKNGTVVGQYNVNTEVDSVIFYKPTLEGNNTNNGDIVFNPNITYGSITDIDGNTYKTVTIGTQTWMAENLRTTKYNDGTAIPLVTDDEEWYHLTTGAYCNYNNTSNTDTIATYGRLYNWYAVNTGKLAPTGWHVPTDAEWATLTTYLGGESVAGGKLKETGTTHWNSPNTSATNETGFTALPGGDRDGNGAFDFIGSYGRWWSATEYSTNSAWLRRVHHLDSSVFRGHYYKGVGFSVRCVRD